MALVESAQAQRCIEVPPVGAHLAAVWFPDEVVTVVTTGTKAVTGGLRVLSVQDASIRALTRRVGRHCIRIKSLSREVI